MKSRPSPNPLSPNFLLVFARLPSVQALAIQAAAILFLLLTHPILEAAKISVSFPISLLVQAVIAVALSRWCGQPIWWQVIHFLFLPAIVLFLLLALPPWIFLMGFLLLLAVFWSTFRTRVPFYASGQAAWDAIATALPARPVKIIDIGSGIGGLVIDIARRRPDCEVQGIELAPLPWLVSRVRQLLGAPGVFHRGDYGRIDLGDYDVVIAYLSPAAMPALWDKARAEMRPGSLLLSHEFPIPDVLPNLTRETRPDGPLLYGWWII